MMDYPKSNSNNKDVFCKSLSGPWHHLQICNNNKKDSTPAIIELNKNATFQLHNALSWKPVYYHTLRKKKHNIILNTFWCSTCGFSAQYTLHRCVVVLRYALSYALIVRVRVCVCSNVYLNSAIQTGLKECDSTALPPSRLVTTRRFMRLRNIRYTVKYNFQTASRETRCPHLRVLLFHTYPPRVAFATERNRRRPHTTTN